MRVTKIEDNIIKCIMAIQEQKISDYIIFVGKEGLLYRLHPDIKKFKSLTSNLYYSYCTLFDCLKDFASKDFNIIIFHEEDESNIAQFIKECL